MAKFSLNRQFGNLGEDLATLFLMKQGYKIVERNYLRKWGEIDIIISRENIISFVEVKSKSVSRDVSRNCFTADQFNLSISHEIEKDFYAPEDNVHFWKQKRILRAIQTYLMDRNVDENQEWQVDVITVKIDFLKKVATIKHIQNVVFDV